MFVALQVSFQHCLRSSSSFFTTGEDADIFFESSIPSKCIKTCLRLAFIFVFIVRQQDSNYVLYLLLPPDNCLLEESEYALLKNADPRLCLEKVLLVFSSRSDCMICCSLILKPTMLKSKYNFLISSQNTSDLKISINIFISIQKNEYFCLSLFCNILSD